ncbi:MULTISPECIES: hypothetical protein [Silvimonas]|uniref:hypothetical protein n=1 Tax=Silvimonas TaxID=300264 RepID=UPI0024B32A28|nr:MULTISPECIES: hypothetical protein [Silvimonas]MDR3428982.1 hypothetical protein [Silvimonas sp.]
MTLGLADAANAGPGARGAARTSVNKPAGGGAHNNGNGGNRVANGNNVGNKTNINNSHNNVNVNNNRDVNVNVENNGRGGYGYDNNYHPIATAAAITATVAVVGAILTPAQMPTSGCVQVMHGNTAYMQCGSTWYQPQYQGSNVTYVVVNAP